MRYFLTLFILLSACNYNKTKAGSGQQPSVSKAQVENPDFQTVQALVIGPKCLSCHANQTGNQGGTNLEGFATVKSKLNRILYRALDARDMPPRRPLSEIETLALRNWADNGAPEKVTGEAPGKPAGDLERGPANWTKIKDRIFKEKCLDCHQAPNPEAGLDLSDLKAVRENMGKIVDRTFVKLDMPLAPYLSLTPVETRVFFKWLGNGMPQ